MPTHFGNGGVSYTGRELAADLIERLDREFPEPTSKYIVEVRVASHTQAAVISMYLRERLRKYNVDVRIVETT